MDRRLLILALAIALSGCLRIHFDRCDDGDASDPECPLDAGPGE